MRTIRGWHLKYWNTKWWLLTAFCSAHHASLAEIHPVTGSLPKPVALMFKVFHFVYFFFSASHLFFICSLSYGLFVHPKNFFTKLAEPTLFKQLCGLLWASTSTHISLKTLTTKVSHFAWGFDAFSIYSSKLGCLCTWKKKNSSVTNCTEPHIQNKWSSAPIQK